MSFNTFSITNIRPLFSPQFLSKCLSVVTPWDQLRVTSICTALVVVCGCTCVYILKLEHRLYSSEKITRVEEFLKRKKGYKAAYCSKLSMCLLGLAL